MRILQVVPRYAPAWGFGGGVRVTYELGCEWVRRGHTVSVYTSDQLDARTRTSRTLENMEGIEVHRFRNPVHGLATRYPYLFYRPAGLKGALRHLAGRYDIVHVVESRGPHNRWVSDCVPLQGIPFVWSAYGGLADGVGFRRVYRSLHDKMFKTSRIVRRAGGLIAQTNHEVETYLRFGASPTRIREIPLGINADEFNQLPRRGIFRARVGIEPQDKVILFVGRIHATKGLDLLMRSFAEVLKVIPTARLVIVGWDQGYLARTQLLVRDLAIARNVLFSVPVYGKARLEIYVDADVFAMTPLFYEETSLAALEAAACGIPCVLTKQCEIPGLEQARGGAVVSATKERVSGAIIDCLSQGAGGIRGENARRLVFERFTTKATAIEHEFFFE